MNVATTSSFVFPSRALPRNEMPEGVIPVYHVSELRLGGICCQSKLVRVEGLDTPQIQMWRCPLSNDLIGTYSNYKGLNQVFGCHPTLGMPMLTVVHPLATSVGGRNAIPEPTGHDKP